MKTNAQSSTLPQLFCQEVSIPGYWYLTGNPAHGGHTPARPIWLAHTKETVRTAREREREREREPERETPDFSDVL